VLVYIRASCQALRASGLQSITDVEDLMFYQGLKLNRTTAVYY